MRSPIRHTAPAVTNVTLLAWIALALIAAVAAVLLLLESPSHLVPPEVLDGLTSPESFGARTT